MNSVLQQKRAQRGFTLIELMIVVVIIGIVTSVALPYFGEVGKRGHRVEAKDMLMSAAAKQEQFFAQYVSYTDVVNGSNSCSGVDCGLNMASNLSKNQKYRMSIAVGPTGCEPGTANACRTFALSAAVNGSHKDDDCPSLTYRSGGVKGVMKGGTDETDLEKIKKCWR